MAPKEPFKVHSLKRHIEDTKRGLSTEAQYNRRGPANRPASAIENQPKAVNQDIFGDNSDSGDESSDSESSSDEGGSDFLRKLAPPATKTAASSRPSKVDEIADSDVERNASAKGTALAVTTKSESSDESSSESESDRSEAKAKTNGAQIKKSPSTSSSSSSGLESDDESGSSSAAKRTSMQTESASESETSESESDESDENDDESAKEHNHDPKIKPASQPAVNGNGTTSTSSSEDSDRNENGSEGREAAKPSQRGDNNTSSRSSSTGGPDDSDSEKADESIHIEDREREGSLALPGFIRPDFVLRKGNGKANGEDVARICNQASMQGKQFWYFTVPSNIPISVVQNMEIPMDQSQHGEPVFSHAGEDYGISFDSMTPKSSIQILIPSADSSQYQAASRRIDQVMQVKRIVQLGVDGSAANSSEQRAPRPQPRGLKARYKPIGVNAPAGQIGMNSGSGGEDLAMTDAPALPAASKKSPGKTSKKKRKHNGTATMEDNKSIKGKRKHASSEDEAAAAAEQLMAESQTAETKSKKPRMDRNGSPCLGSEPPSSAGAQKRQTHVIPPTVPNPSSSFSNLGSAPAAASAPVKSSATVNGKAKTSSKSEGETLVPARSSSLSLPGKKTTPVPIPPRQTAVPIPQVPGPAQQPKVSPVPIPRPMMAVSAGKGEKKVKERKDKGRSQHAADSSQQSPPESARPSGKGVKKVTPVPAPQKKTLA